MFYFLGLQEEVPVPHVSLLGSSSISPSLRRFLGLWLTFRYCWRRVVGSIRLLEVGVENSFCVLVFKDGIPTPLIFFCGFLGHGDRIANNMYRI